MVVTPGMVNGHIHISYAHATRGIFPGNVMQVDYEAGSYSNIWDLMKDMNEEEEWTYLRRLSCP